MRPGRASGTVPKDRSGSVVPSSPTLGANRRLKQVSDARQTSLDYITDESGQKKAVVLSVDQYQELLEDLDDLGVIAGHRDEATMTHEELLEELRDGGLG